MRKILKYSLRVPFKTLTLIKTHKIFRLLIDLSATIMQSLLCSPMDGLSQSKYLSFIEFIIFKNGCKNNSLESFLCLLFAYYLSCFYMVEQSPLSVMGNYMCSDDLSLRNNKENRSPQI